VGRTAMNKDVPFYVEGKKSFQHNPVLRNTNRRKLNILLLFFLTSLLKCQANHYCKIQYISLRWHHWLLAGALVFVIVAWKVPIEPIKTW